MESAHAKGRFASENRDLLAGGAENFVDVVSDSDFAGGASDSDKLEFLGRIAVIGLKDFGVSFLKIGPQTSVRTPVFVFSWTFHTLFHNFILSLLGGEFNYKGCLRRFGLELFEEFAGDFDVLEIVRAIGAKNGFFVAFAKDKDEIAGLS